MVFYRIFQPSQSEPLDFELSIEATLLDLAKRFRIKKILYDPYQLAASMQRLAKERLPVEEYPQTLDRLTAMSQQLYDLIMGQAFVAFDTAITSADIAALIDEAEAGIAKAEKEATVDQTLSLDPKAARQAIADAAFAADRLRILLSQLQVRYREVHSREQAKAWLAEYDVMKRKRDALAEELREVFPEAENKIVDLFVRITDNCEALSELHQARPPGVMEHLLSAELHARGLDRFTPDTPSLLTAVVLFDWNTGREIWPLPRPSISAAFAASMVPAYDPADWANNYERRAAAQQQERQYRADYYARLTKEQEARENREARERFAASQRRNST